MLPRPGGCEARQREDTGVTVGEVVGTSYAEALADKTVGLLSPSAGQVIMIWASSHSLDLIEALAFRIRERGAFWTLRLVMEPLLQRVGLHVPEPYLGLVPEHELRWLADVDAIVEVRDHGSHVPDVPVSRRRAMGAEWRALIDAANERHLRRIAVLHATPALAAACGISPERLRELCWQAIDADQEAMDGQQAALGEMLSRADEVHIRSALGTDLRLRLGERPVHQDRDSLPRGEVYVAPVEDSAEGIAVIDRLFLQGRPVDRLRLTFSRGRVAKVEAREPEDAQALLDLLKASSGKADVIGEFAIGLNPGAVEPVGLVALDEKIGGSVHIAVGANQALGGRNRSNLHLDMVILHPTVALDGDLVLVDGVLQSL